MHAHLCGGTKNKLDSKGEQSRCSSPGCFHPQAQSNRATDVSERENWKSFGWNLLQNLPVLPPCFSQLWALCPLCANSFPSNHMLKGLHYTECSLEQRDTFDCVSNSADDRKTRARALWSLSFTHTHTSVYSMSLDAKEISSFSDFLFALNLPACASTLAHCVPTFVKVQGNWNKMVIAKNKGHFAMLLQAYVFCCTSSAGQRHIREISWHLSNPQKRNMKRGPF